MAAVETAILTAMLGRLQSLTLSPVLPISWPGLSFNPPTPGPTVRWLRGTLLPAETFPLAVSFAGANRHAGLFQVDVFGGIGGGETALARIAALIIGHFKRGTSLSEDGFTIEITDPPSRLPLLVDGPWLMVPVRVRYLAFAANPA